MKLSPHYLKRYKDITRLLLKYGRPGIHSRFQFDEPAAGIGHNGRNHASELPDDLERLGPSYVKLGQLLSSRTDLVPEYYLKSLARLQDHVKPFPWKEVQATIESELGSGLGTVFSSFDPQPLAAASLGQVHRASLRDGRQVAVKVQRPNIGRQIEYDFEAFEEIAGFLERHTRFGQRYQLSRILNEFETTLVHELDYRREAGNMIALDRNLRKFEHILIPLPVPEFTKRKVLTMDYVPGTKITDLTPEAIHCLDGRALAEELFRAYLQQILVDGIFHADPHPGNIFITDDGMIALLDLGMVGHTMPMLRENLLKLLLAVSEGEGDHAAEAAIRISNSSFDFDTEGFRHRIGQLVAEQQNTTLQQMDVGRVVLEVSRCAADTGLFVPTELSLLGKTLLQLDQVGRTLYPRFDPNEAIRRNASQILNARIKSFVSEGKLFSGLLEAKELIGELPARLNKILDTIGNAEFTVNVKPAETEFLVESARKVANRITTGLVLAALIVGAALMMRVPARFHVFGYPLLAILCFLIAAGAGMWLVASILWQDHKSRQKTRAMRFD